MYPDEINVSYKLTKELETAIKEEETERNTPPYR
jgi:hypothetical protein